jgi:hypothetical protein
VIFGELEIGAGPGLLGAEKHGTTNTSLQPLDQEYSAEIWAEA